MKMMYKIGHCKECGYDVIEKRYDGSGNYDYLNYCTNVRCEEHREHYYFEFEVYEYVNIVLDYLKKQGEWCIKNGIEKGSLVKVKRLAYSDELGWDNEWVDSMDDYVNNTYEVVKIDRDGIELLDGDLCGGYSFPYFVLENADE